MPFFEQVLLTGGATLQIWLGGGARYRLRYGRPGTWLVSYEGQGARHRRTVADRAGSYEFRSVEQLRYDFERDVAACAQD